MEGIYIISEEKLQDVITQTTNKVLEGVKNIMAPKAGSQLASMDNEKYLTREQVKDLFNISYGTLNNWTKAGAIKGYRMGSRVYYKEIEIHQALKPMDTGN